MARLMLTLLGILWLFSGSFLLGQGLSGSEHAVTAPPDEATPARPSATYGKLRLRFDANRGQTDPQVKFLARGRGYGLFLTVKEAVLTLSRPVGRSSRQPCGSAQEDASTKKQPSVAVIRMRLVGGNPEPRIVGLDPLRRGSLSLCGVSRS